MFLVRSSAARPANAQVKLNQPATHRSGVVEQEVACHVFECVGMKMTAAKPNAAAGKNLEYVYLPWDTALWTVSQEEVARLRHLVLDNRPHVAAEVFELTPNRELGGEADRDAEVELSQAEKMEKLEKVRLALSTAKKPKVQSSEPRSEGLTLDQIMAAMDVRAAERERNLMNGIKEMLAAKEPEVTIVRETQGQDQDRRMDPERNFFEGIDERDVALEFDRKMRDHPRPARFAEGAASVPRASARDATREPSAATAVKKMVWEESSSDDEGGASVTDAPMKQLAKLFKRKDGEDSLVSMGKMEKMKRLHKIDGTALMKYIETKIRDHMALEESEPTRWKQYYLDHAPDLRHSVQCSYFVDLLLRMREANEENDKLRMRGLIASGLLFSEQAARDCAGTAALNLAWESALLEPAAIAEQNVKRNKHGSAPPDFEKGVPIRLFPPRLNDILLRQLETTEKLTIQRKKRLGFVKAEK